MHAFGDDPYQEMLAQFAATLPKPRAIVFVSAHTISSDDVHILRTNQNTIQHDFNGFPDDLYKINYSCPGDTMLADQVAKLLTEAHFEIRMESQAPLDHGVWIPLMHLYPKGDVPVVRVSLPVHLKPAQILKMGHALAALREKGILLIASGGAVHNLRELKWSEKNGKGESYANQFEEFLVLALKNKDVEAILHSEELPFFKAAHPTPEHFLPIVFSIGAARTGDEATILFRGIEYGTLSMLCFSLNHAQDHSLH